MDFRTYEGKVYVVLMDDDTLVLFRSTENYEPGEVATTRDVLGVERHGRVWEFPVEDRRPGHGLNWISWHNLHKNIRSVRIADGQTIRPTSCANMFCGCESLESLNLSGLDTSRVKVMSSMFADCKSLKSLDLSGLDTSHVTDMYDMFACCTSLESLDLSSWDTSNVTCTMSMFSDCESLERLDLSAWDTSNVTHMNYMFARCKSLERVDVASWDVSKVTNMNSMFQHCPNLRTLDLSSWDTSSVTDMSWMFHDCRSLESLDVSGWDTSNATNMYDMFAGCKSLEKVDVASWDVSKVTNMDHMFERCHSLESLDLSAWDMSMATSMRSAFAGCPNLKVSGIAVCDTPKPQDMIPSPSDHRSSEPRQGDGTTRCGDRPVMPPREHPSLPSNLPYGRPYLQRLRSSNPTNPDDARIKEIANVLVVAQCLVDEHGLIPYETSVNEKTVLPKELLSHILLEAARYKTNKLLHHPLAHRVTDTFDFDTWLDADAIYLYYLGAVRASRMSVAEDTVRLDSLVSFWMDVSAQLESNATETQKAIEGRRESFKEDLNRLGIRDRAFRYMALTARMLCLFLSFEGQVIKKADVFDLLPDNSFSNMTKENMYKYLRDSGAFSLVGRRPTRGTIDSSLFDLKRIVQAVDPYHAGDYSGNEFESLRALNQTYVDSILTIVGQYDIKPDVAETASPSNKSQGDSTVALAKYHLALAPDEAALNRPEEPVTGHFEVDYEEDEADYEEW